MKISPLKFSPLKIFLFIAMALTVVAFGNTTTYAQQASITLTNSDAKYCYTHDNKWDLTKTVAGNTVDAATGTGAVTWTIAVTKDASAAATFSVHGGLTVTNTGSAPATIGNIVVNLQKPNSPKKGSNASHVSIAADVANATNGDSATSANIAAAATQENAATNAAWGTNNYTVSGAQGTFTETAGSGKLEFKDASNNTIFSLVPQSVIPVGASVTLLYDAEFQTSILPPAGALLRVEALVSFGNSGARGGSGSSATNIDVNGNGIIDADEANVRTVPSRVTLAALPAAPQEANASVTITDNGPTASGTVTASNPVGFEQFPAIISNSATFMVSVDVDAGADGGEVCNAAQLTGSAIGGTLNVVVGYDTTDPLNPIPIYATYTCVDAAQDEDGDCADINAARGFQPGDYTTYTQGGWGATPNGTNPASILANNFATVYPGGFVEVGIPGAGGFSMKFTSASAIAAYLPAGKTAGALTADLVNPTSSSSGVFGGQVLALQLNVDFSAAGTTQGPGGPVGNLQLCNTGTSLDGMTVAQILAAANTALGGGGLPDGFTFSALNALVTNLNEAFDNGTVSPFANDHLCR